MSDKGIGSLAFAKQFREWIAAEVREQIKKAAPPRRIAEVVEINTDTRRAGVVYVGDDRDNVVSVPFNSAVPTGAGQFVAIGGPPGDRSIVDVVGPSATEKRLDDAATTEAVVPISLSANPRTSESFPMILRPKDPSTDYRFSLAAGVPVYVPVQVTHTADYESVFSSFTESIGTSTGINFALYKYMMDDADTSAGQTAMDMRRIGIASVTNSDQEMYETFARIRLDDSVYLEQGEVVVVGIFYTGSTQMHVRALYHTQVPLAHVPKYTVGWSNFPVSTHPEYVRDADMSRAYDKTVYAGISH